MSYLILLFYYPERSNEMNANLIPDPTIVNQFAKAHPRFAYTWLSAFPENRDDRLFSYGGLCFSFDGE
jgi:hypothetical protein